MNRLAVLKNRIDLVERRRIKNLIALFALDKRGFEYGVYRRAPRSTLKEK